MFKNKFGLYVRHFLTRRERCHCKLTQVVGVTRPDMNEKINRTGDMVKLDHLRQAECMAAKRLNIRFVVAPEPYCDHGLDTNTQAWRVYFSVKSGYDPGTLQNTNPDQAGRSRQTDNTRDLLVGNPSIIS